MNNKKTSLLFAIIFAMGALMIWPTASFAGAAAQSQTSSTPTPVSSEGAVTPTSKNLLQGMDIALSDLGIEKDVLLNGPYDSFYLQFTTPANWQLKEGAVINLNLSVNILSPSGVTTFSGAKVEVQFDNLWIQTVMLDRNGDFEFKIPIPVDRYQKDGTYVPMNPGEHSIYLFMDASQDCEDYYQNDSVVKGRIQTSVTVKANSNFDLSHTLMPLETNLAALPYPIYQENMILPSKALMVVPDQPSQLVAQSALIVMTGFSRMTTGSLKLEMIPLSQLSETSITQSNLIFVGNSKAFPLLASINLPAPLLNEHFEIPYGQPDDGIIQFAASPWNSSNTILVVTGNSDDGVLKASKAVSTGKIMGGEKPNLAVISNIQPEAVNGQAPEDHTLSDLGYQQTNKLTGIGHPYSVYTFNIPPELGTNNDAYLDLVFSHSAMLNTGGSGLDVTVNDINFGSVVYSTETTSTTTQRFSVPPYAVHVGVNVLEIRVNHSLQDACLPADLEIWTQIINDQSNLHIPLVKAPSGLSPILDLKFYPMPLASVSDLGDIVFVLPPNDANAFSAASKIAYQLGSKTTGPMVNLQVEYANALSESIRKEKNLILVGKPTALQVLSEINQQLPVPFKPGSNLAAETALRVSYSLPENIDIGYLELFNSPWNSNRFILSVLGSSDKGLQWAADALIKPSSPLIGNYAITDGKEVFSTDTRQGTATILAGTAFPLQATPVVVNTDEFLSQTNSVFETPPLINVDPKVWIPYVIVGVTLLIIIILVFVLVTSFKQRSSRIKK